jgi:hypothetical protein
MIPKVADFSNEIMGKMNEIGPARVTSGDRPWRTQA